MDKCIGTITSPHGQEWDSAERQLIFHVNTSFETCTF
jgi:hypothetical protein